MTGAWDDLPTTGRPLFGDPDDGGADPTTGELPDRTDPPEVWRAGRPDDVLVGTVVEVPTTTQLVGAAGEAMTEWRGAAVAQRAAEVGDALVAHLRYVHGEHVTARPSGRVTNAVVQPELVWLAGAADTLGAIAGAFTTAHREARDLAGEVVAEVRPDKADAGSATVKVGGGSATGGTIKVTRTQPTQVATDTDALIDLLPAWLLSQEYTSTTAQDESAGNYAAGARDALALLLQLTSPPKWKSTALDQLAVAMANADEGDLAARLAKAYGRVAHGEARTTIEHVPDADAPYVPDAADRRWAKDATRMPPDGD